MKVVGNSLPDAIELLTYSLFGPFTGWVFDSPGQQWFVCLAALLLVAPVLFWKNMWAIVAAILGIALWLLPNALPMWTGI